MNVILAYLIFPGFLFAGLIGLLATWIDRKVTARLQYRVGPPWFQPWADLLKLLGKETIVPTAGNRIVFLTAPLIGLAGVVLAAVTLWPTKAGYSGDLIVVIYLLLLPAIALMLGGSASGNPLSAIGASREMKLILSYELPFVLVISTVILKCGGIDLGSLTAFQAKHGWLINSFSGALSALAALIVGQAKLGAVPFDLAEAEQELAAGAILEYSGPALAVIKLTRAILYYIIPLFLVVLFLGGFTLTPLGMVELLVKYLIILTIIILLKNTNPRLRIDQALRLFWGPVTVIAAFGFILALFGW
jgi:NADH-quinone oxidoreductase subunit H